MTRKECERRLRPCGYTYRGEVQYRYLFASCSGSGLGIWAEIEFDEGRLEWYSREWRRARRQAVLEARRLMVEWAEGPLNLLIVRNCHTCQDGGPGFPYCRPRKAGGCANWRRRRP